MGPFVKKHVAIAIITFACSECERALIRTLTTTEVVLSMG